MALLFDLINPELEVPHTPVEVSPTKFDGDTFHAGADRDRLADQAKRVWGAMLARQWSTLRELSDDTGAPEASVSARMRDFRKARFGGHTIERRRRGDLSRGIHEYKLVPNGASQGRAE